MANSAIRKPAFTRSVSARLIERFIFNFRLSPDALRKHLPVTWLKPQVINGYSVVSFCILRLAGLMLSPIPSFFGFDTISCAYRCGVVDFSEVEPIPSVYIVGRNTDLPIITMLGPVLFRNAMPKVRTAILHKPDFIDIQASYLDGGTLFSAKVKRSETPDQLESKVFDSVDAFMKFIHDGSSSYAPSVHDKYFSRVDLYKEDSNYESLDVNLSCSWLNSAWRDADLVFDSALRAGGGGLYKWTYLGVAPEKIAESQILLEDDISPIANPPPHLLYH